MNDDRRAEYRRVGIEVAMRLFCQYPDMPAAQALAAAGRFVDELRQQDAQSDTSACHKNSPEPHDNAVQPESPALQSERPALQAERPVVNPCVTAAIARYVEDSDGDIEVDLDAAVSFADGGAFVQMWGWVDNTWS